MALKPKWGVRGKHACLVLTLLHLQVGSEGGNVCLELALIHFKVFQLL